jgi:hypothetical protein
MFVSLCQLTCKYELKVPFDMFANIAHTWYVILISGWRHCESYPWCGGDSVDSIATRYGLDGPVIESTGDEMFRNPPVRPWSQPNLLHNGYRFIPESKAAEAWS